MMQRIERSMGWVILSLLLGGAGVGTVSLLFGQTKPGSIANTWQIKPQTLTTTAAVNPCSLPGGPPCGKDLYVCWLDASTATSSSTLTVADLQTVPVNFANAVSIAANSVYSPMMYSPMDQACRWFPGGMTITASVANTVNIYISGKWWNGKAPF